MLMPNITTPNMMRICLLQQQQNFILQQYRHGRSIFSMHLFIWLLSSQYFYYQVNYHILVISMHNPTGMIYRNFGNSGIKISAISIGTATYSSPDQLENNQLTIEMALKNGINYFDSSEIYGGGEAEQQLGTILKNLKVARQDIVVGTKILTAVNPDRNSTMSTNRKHIKQSVQKSLQRLQMDYVDIIYAHIFDPETPLEQICRAFHEIIQNGESFYWATSNWQPECVYNAIAICQKNNLHKPIGAQNNYNMFKRENTEVEYESLFSKYGYGLIAWSPLAGGILTGKYGRELEEGEVTRFTDKNAKYPLDRVRKMFYDPFATEKNFNILKELEVMAKELECKLTHLALAWVIKYDFTSSALIGVRDVKQLEDTLLALKVIDKLTVEVEQRINKILDNNPTPLHNYIRMKPYPHSRPVAK